MLNNPASLSSDPTAVLIGFCVALGVGLLIGAERERRKGHGPNRAPAGIRTFAVAALTGAVAMYAGGGMLFAVVVLVVGALSLLAYQRSRALDPGLTTEVALVLTTLLGGLAMRDAAIAAGVGAALALLLAARERLHRFVRGVLTEQELHDALLLAAVLLIALPLAPDRDIGPFNAINPHTLVLLIVLVMSINALGYVATRLLGARFGLPIAGLAGGFVSSTATIHAMGTRIRQARQGDESADSQLALIRAATAGAVLSSVATLVQMMLVLWMLQRELAMHLAWPMLAGIVASVVYAAFFVRRALGSRTAVRTEATGRAFDPVAALGFTTIVAALLVLVAALNHWLGSQGVLLSAFLGGFVDAHAAAASVASVMNRADMGLNAATWAILVGVTSNALMKLIVALQSGGPKYAWRIGPGLVIMLAVLWLLAALSA
jgi:uncharacterized membrane protein (DUF4010 family)